MTNETEIPNPEIVAVVKFPPKADFSGIEIRINRWYWSVENGAYLERTPLEAAVTAGEVWQVLDETIGAREVGAAAPPAAARPAGGGGGPRPAGGGAKPQPVAAEGWYCDDCSSPAKRQPQAGRMPGDAIVCGGDCKNDQGYPLTIAWVRPGTDEALPKRGR